MARNSKPPEFEQGLEELENLVERLERGDLPLDEALRDFERGVELTRHCQSALKAAQQRVEILLRRNEGEPEPVPFLAEEDAQSAAEPVSAAIRSSEEGSVLPPATLTAAPHVKP